MSCRVHARIRVIDEAPRDARKASRPPYRNRTLFAGGRSDLEGQNIQRGHAPARSNNGQLEGFHALGHFRERLEELSCKGSVPRSDVDRECNGFYALPARAI